MRFLTLILMPYCLVWMVTKSRHRIYRLFAFLTILFVQIFSMLPIGTTVFAYLVSYQNETITVETAKFGELYSNYRVSQSSLHGLSGWKGIDITGGCGSPIYAPFDGQVTYVGLDGYSHLDERGMTWPQSTMLTIQGNNGYELTLLHGEYLVSKNDTIIQGDLIGTEASYGWSTGCHSHVILKQNGRTLNYLTWIDQQKTIDYSASVERPSGLSTAQKPLKISWYDPLLGGINCDSDCTTMASGTKVTEDRYGRSAACIAGWMGKTVVIEGLGEFTCLDRGGAIVEHPGYIWIDLLLHEPLPGAPFGTLIYQWEFKQ